MIGNSAGPVPQSTVKKAAKRMSPMQFAETMIGMGERPNQRAIQDYLRTGGANLDPATTAWCAAFVNSSLGQAGFKGTGSNMARSFLSYGQAVDQPQRGDIAVFSRGNPNGPFGHVGFFDSFNPDGSIRVLGGNQSDSVRYSNYGRDQLLGFRRPGDPTGTVTPTPQTPQPGGAQPGPAPASPGTAPPQAPPTPALPFGLSPPTDTAVTPEATPDQPKGTNWGTMLAMMAEPSAPPPELAPMQPVQTAQPAVPDILQALRQQRYTKAPMPFGLFFGA